MKKILLYGAPLHNNLGGPSIYYGIKKILTECYGDEIQINYLKDTSHDIYTIQKKFYDEVVFKHDLKSLFRWIITIYLKRNTFLNKDQKIIFDLINKSDLVINCWGICFSDKLLKPGLIKTFFPDIISILSKKLGKKTINYTASFGPIVHKRTNYAAKKSLSKYFDLIFCREFQSKSSLENIGIKTPIEVFPDTGLLMDISKNQEWDGLKDKTIGLTLSFQMKKQLPKDFDYIGFFAKLADDLIWNKECSIVFFPNDYVHGVVDDFNISELIIAKMKYHNKAAIFPLTNYDAETFKYYLSKCHMVLATRYHTVVAALSSSVPTFVLGWHYKYNELLELYGQEKYYANEENINYDVMYNMIEEILDNRALIHNELKSKNTLVQNKVLDAKSKIISILPV